MARPYKVIIVDGMELQVEDFSTNIVTYSHEIIQQFVAEGKPNVKMTIRYKGMRFESPIDGMEVKGDTVYVYGPFRRMFPALFAGKLLLPWQQAYLRSRMEFQSLDLYRYWRDDGIFETLPATYFHKGFEAARKYYS